jgi:hypothetical protein
MRRFYPRVGAVVRGSIVFIMHEAAEATSHTLLGGITFWTESDIAQKSMLNDRARTLPGLFTSHLMYVQADRHALLLHSQ